MSMCTCTWTIRPITLLFFFFVCFLGTCFSVFNKLGDFFFSLVVCHFFVLIGHHFLTKVYE